MPSIEGLKRTSKRGGERRRPPSAALALAVLVAAPAAIAQVGNTAPTTSGVFAIPSPASPPAAYPPPDAAPGVESPASGPAIPPAVPQEPGRPAAQPIDQLGEARWSDGVGFVQPAPEKQDATKDRPGDGGTTVPKVGDIGLNQVALRVGIGSMSLNPTNDDGRTADATAVTVMEIPAQLRLEFRTATSLIAPWLDGGLSVYMGSKTESIEGTTTDRSMSVSGFRMKGRFGLDFHALPMLGGGPFIGYGRDFLDAAIESSSSTSTTESELEGDGGLLLGLHARYRTKETPQEPARFYADGAFTLRNGEYTSARYVELEAGVRLGSLYLLGWFEKRVSASGSFSFGGSSTDATTLSQAMALSMPVDQRLGIGISTLL